MSLSLSQSSVLNILTFGAGAIGTYIGGSLSLAGHNVVFVEQPNIADELRERGLRLDLTIDDRRKAKDAFIVAPIMSVPVILWAFFIPRRYGMENCSPIQKQTA